MVKQKLSLLVLICILAISFNPAFADNDLVLRNNDSKTELKEDNSLLRPKKRPKKRSGRKGKRGGGDQSKLRFGFEAGANMTAPISSKEYQDIARLNIPVAGLPPAVLSLFKPNYLTSSSLGFQAGAYVDFNLTEMFFVEGGLYATMKPYKEVISAAIQTPVAASISITNEASPIYVELPILFGLNLGLSDNFSINIKAGGYFAFGVAGNLKLTTSVVAPMIPKNNDTQTIDFFRKETNKLDYGIRAGLGAEFSKITLGVFMDYGLSNLIKDAPDKIKFGLFTLGLNAGYKF